MAALFNSFNPGAPAHRSGGIIVMVRIVLALIVCSAFTSTAFGRAIELEEPDTVIAGEPVRFVLSFYEDTIDILAFTNGFKVYTKQSLANPAQSGYFEPITFDTLCIILSDIFDLGVSVTPFGVDGLGADTIGLYGICTPAHGMVPSLYDSVFWVETIPHVAGDTLCIDSSWFPPGGNWEWINYLGYHVEPLWSGPFCFPVECTPAFVVQTWPYQHETDIPADTAAVVQFSRAMNETSFTPSSFVLHGKTQGVYQGCFDSDPSQITFKKTPFWDFGPGETITATLTSEITSQDGQGLQPYSWTFRVAAEEGESFALDTLSAPITSPACVAVADIDGDRDLDIVSCVWGSALWKFFNDGNGTFGTPVTQTLQLRPIHIAVGDLNLDGDVDLVLADIDSGTCVLYNIGDGDFGIPWFYSSTPAQTVEVADLNNDGYLDIITAAPSTNEVIVCMNDGDGTLTETQSIGAGDFIAHACADDFSNDGWIDVAACSYNTNEVSILLNDSTGTLLAPTFVAPGCYRTNWLASGDMDRDGDADLAVASCGSDAVVLLYNDGTGAFTPVDTVPVGDYPRIVALVDFDGDGDLDLASVSRDDTCVAVNYCNPGHCGNPILFPASGNLYNIVSGDLDGNGTVDMLIGSGNGVLTSLMNLPASCCVHRGDIDHSGGTTPIDISDLVYLVDFMFSGGPEPPCSDEGDVDGSGVAPIDISDLVYLVDYMFNSGPAPPGCP